MSDLPSRSEENGEEFFKEIEEGIIINNTELLRMKFVGTQPGDPQDEKTETALLAIKIVDTPQIAGKIHHRITIPYNTNTGEISPIGGKYLGDFSLIRTDLVEIASDDPKSESPKKIILLYRGENEPAPWAFDEAISGLDTGPHTGTQRIMPERLSPDHPDLRGISEVWGESQFVDNAKGDLIMLKTIRKFNETYGPPK